VAASDGEYERQALSAATRVRRKMPPQDTIYALSSGQPPAAIAIVRLSGAQADTALERLAGRLPPPRRASLVTLRDAQGEMLDRCVAIRFPGPASATGEDLVELHLHGGRAVVAAVLNALGRVPGLRAAAPGEFTRRSFDNGRIDLLEAEGLADLLTAETEGQRRAALRLAEGELSRFVEHCRARVLALAARVEATLDFSDEDDVGQASDANWSAELSSLRRDLRGLLDRPSAERLRDGVRVVVAGPPNAGKSSLINAMAGREAAITSAVPGTTRDLIEVPLSLGGLPFLLIDSAGLRESADVVEAIGVSKAEAAIAGADILLWLGEPQCAPEHSTVLRVRSKLDILGPSAAADLSVSAHSGEGLTELVERLVTRAGAMLPAEGEAAINERQRAALAAVDRHLKGAGEAHDALIVAEELRCARAALDKLTGCAGVEDMLEALFGRFCIGK
jgi:tRNA modification GTPase